MAEEVVGIQCYVNDVPGFSGVLKHRYADFCVNEVDLEGNVVQLTDLRAPKEVVVVPETQKPALPEDPGRQDAAPSPTSLSAAQPIAAASSDIQVAQTTPTLPTTSQAQPGATLEAIHGSAQNGTSTSAGKVGSAPSGDLKTDSLEAKVEGPVDESQADVAAFRELVGEEDAAKLESLLKAVKAGEATEPLILAPDADKAHRTAVHQFFKARLPMLLTDTVDFKGAKCFAPSNGKVPNEVSQKSVRVYLNKKWQPPGDTSKRGNKRKADDKSTDGGKRAKNDDAPLDPRGRGTAWPNDRPKHVRFTMYKENKDSHEAMGLIGKMLGVLPKAFGYAGTKDKRGVTVQHLTLHRITAEKLAALNPRLFSIQLGNFSYVPEGLQLGQLCGNQFAITLRGVPLESQEHAVAAAEALRRHGFVNYFGLQRFGTGTVGTHEVGAALLKGAFKAAVDLLLRPRGEEREDAAAARAYFARTRDAAGTLQKMPYYMNAERSLLQRLRGAPYDWVGALACIPRTLRMMYVHAYQSFLWNHAATHRIMLYGSERAVEGDLVFAGEQEVVAPYSGAAAEDDVGSRETADFDIPASHRVKHVTSAEAEAGTYRIEDVLLPLPGGATQYPGHETEAVYHDVAAQHGVNLFKCSHSVKEYSIACLTGGYRKLLQKPKDMEWQLIRYSDPDQPLWPTAIDRIAAQPKAPTWLARFRQNKASEKSGPRTETQADVLTALRKSFTVVRGAIASELEGGGTTGSRAEDEMQRQETVASETAGGSGVQLEGEKVSQSQSETVATGGSVAPDSRVDSSREEEADATQIDGGVDRSTGEGHAEEKKALGPLLALQLKLTLPSSCYATMAIRELLKSSTSKDFHRSLQKETTKD